MNTLTFKYTILYVEDVPETLKFFVDAFGFNKTLLHESGDYGELDTGSTKLSFSSLSLRISASRGLMSSDTAFLSLPDAAIKKLTTDNG